MGAQGQAATVGVRATRNDSGVRGPGPAEAGRWRGAAGRAWVFLAVLFGLVAIWEGYRAFGVATHLTWPFPVNDNTMPHIYNMIAQLFEPSRRNGPLLVHVLTNGHGYGIVSPAVAGVLASAAGVELAGRFNKHKPRRV